MFHFTVFRRTIRRGAAMGLVVLGTLYGLTGCQSPGTSNPLGFAQSQAPNFTTSATHPAVATMNDTAGGTGELYHLSASSTPVAQVGFVDRLQSGFVGGCGACSACAQGAQCQSCQPSYPIAMGRPVDPQEYLCNGGDLPPAARLLRDDSLSGLNPQDALVHYTTDAGKVELQPSNTVCVYAPRFGAIRQVSGAVAGEKAVGLGGTYQPLGPNGIGMTMPSLVVGDVRELAHADVARRIDAMRERTRGVPVEGILQPLVAEDVLQILATLELVSLNQLDESQIAMLKQGALAAQSWMVRDAVEVMIESLTPPVLIRDARVEAFVEYDFPDAGRLQIIKVADRDHAQQGEEVVFTIHVKNVGDSPVRQVEIADSLVARLEYVEDSQHCDRPAEFTTAGNAAGSVRMKWSLAEPMAVGDSVTIEFKCKVR